MLRNIIIGTMVLGLLAGSFFAGMGARGKENNDLRKRADAVEFDLGIARNEQLKAERNAEQLEQQLRISEQYARKLDGQLRDATNTIERLNNSLGIALKSTSAIGRGINDSTGSAAESGGRIDELGGILRGIQDRSQQTNE